MERRAAATSSTFYIELAVIAAVIFNISAAVDGTTDPNDGTGLIVFLYFFGSSFWHFNPHLLLLLGLIWLESFWKWKFMESDYLYFSQKKMCFVKTRNFYFNVTSYYAVWLVFCVWRRILLLCYIMLILIKILGLFLLGCVVS